MTVCLLRAGLPKVFWSSAGRRHNENLNKTKPRTHPTTGEITTSFAIAHDGAAYEGTLYPFGCACAYHTDDDIDEVEVKVQFFKLSGDTMYEIRGLACAKSLRTFDIHS